MFDDDLIKAKSPAPHIIRETIAIDRARALRHWTFLRHVGVQMALFAVGVVMLVVVYVGAGWLAEALKGTSQ